jgi:hypothetical protein
MLRNFTTSMLACSFLMASGLIASHAIAAPVEFTAKYELYRNGKLLGSSEISAKKSGAGYAFQTSSQSEGGWAMLVGGAEIKETSQFVLRGAQFVPTSYQYRQSVSVKKKTRDIQFDWNKNLVQENDGKNRSSYALQPGTLDRHVVVLKIAEDLKAKVAALSYPVAYKGQIEVWKFANKGVEKITTPMGNFDAIRIDRVREGSDRTTISWHAEKYSFLPIQISQTEPDGETMEMRLKSMQITPAR